MRIARFGVTLSVLVMYDDRLIPVKFYQVERRSRMNTQRSTYYMYLVQYSQYQVQVHAVMNKK